MSNIIDSIQLSGVTYTLQGSGGGTVDTALDSGSTNPVENRVIYNKIDEVEQVTARALNELNEEVSEKQDTLVSGTNIKTINNTSILGSGNIDIQGGGKAIEAGRGISVTTGETADTVSISLPISAGTGDNSIAEGYGTIASGGCSHAEGMETQANGNFSHAEGRGTTANTDYSHAEGRDTIASGYFSHAEGYYTKAYADYSHAEGQNTKANGTQSHTEGGGTIANNKAEHASGQYNVSSSASTTFGDSGNTLFSVGNGTSSSARHNAFEIRQNGDIYLSSGGTDIKLQDHLGGGSITVDTALDSASTNPVENRVIYNKIDEVEQVTARALNDLNEKKQDTLSAGTGISISGNVISATGGGGGGTVDSAITSGSTNAVQSSAIWSATTYNKDVTIEFDSTIYSYSTNFPSGCTTVKVEASDMSYSNIDFYSDDFAIGHYSIDFLAKKVTNNFTDSTYEISGNTVIITYPSSKNVNRLAKTSSNGNQTVKAVVEGAWVNENTYMKSEVDGKVSTLQNNINAKLDSTAYTPTVVDSALNVASTNPIQNQALYHELRFVNGESETTLTFENSKSTNYPNGCTKLNVEVVGSSATFIVFYSSDNQVLGNIEINIWDSNIDVDNSFDGASYEISGTTVIITYPTVTNVTKIMVGLTGDDNYVYKAVVPSATPLKDQVVANTTALSSVETRLTEDEEVTAAGLNALNDAFGGLKLVKITQSAYNALTTKDSSTLYIIVN